MKNLKKINGINNDVKNLKNEKNIKDNRRIDWYNRCKNNYIKLFFLIILVLTIFVILKNMEIKKEYVAYNNFLKYVEELRVNEVTLSSNEKIDFSLSSDLKKYYTDNPRKENFKEELLIKGIKVNEKNNSDILSIFLFIAFASFGYFIISKLFKGKLNIKESNVNFQDVPMNVKSKIDFSLVAGNEEAKESLLDVVDFLKYPEKYKKYGARMPKGIIFYGPPGTGKTLMARALAGEANVPFYAVTGSDFVQMYVGVGASRIRELFKRARSNEKAVIFIDEIDALARKRGVNRDGGNDERDQTLNALLTEMSGFNENESIVVVAATNRLDVLDEAILRPGRFDRNIEIGLPDVNARKKILRAHCVNKPISDDVNLEDVAEQTVYFSGAMLENLLNEASIIAAKYNKEYITSDIIDKSFYIVVAGNEKKDKSMITKNDKKITAYHEIGHVIATKVLKPENKVSKVTIIPSIKGSGGYTMNIPKDKMYNTKMDIENEIKILLAGRAAEEIKLGKENITTGATNDLERANVLLDNYIRKYGMSEKYGLVSMISVKEDNELIEYKNQKLNLYYDDVKNILKGKIVELEQMTNALIKKETLDEFEIDEILC